MAPPNHEPSDIESKPQGPTLDELFEIARRASLKRRLRVTLVVAFYVFLGFLGTMWYAYFEGKQDDADGVAPLTTEETHLIKVRTEKPGGREVPNHDRPRTMAKEQPSAVVSAIEPSGSSKNAREVASGANSKFAYVTAGAGGYMIQLAALRSPERVHREWQRLRKNHGDLLDQLRLIVVRVDLGAKGILYRLRLGQFRDRAAAQEVCAELAVRNVDCLVVIAQTDAPKGTAGAQRARATAPVRL